jgi:hypothetical protein
MFSKRTSLVAALLVGAVAFVALQGADKPKDLWWDPNDSSLPPDVKFQGEYLSQDGKVGCQVISLGQKTFQAVVYPGGLPGAGWEGKERILMDGVLEGEDSVFTTHVTFRPAGGKRSYMAKKPEEFAATRKFPPEGQKDYTGTLDLETLTIKTDDDKKLTLKKTVRKSDTLGAKPPEGAVVLFDGSNTDAWDGNAGIDPDTKQLYPKEGDMRTKQKFNNYTAHIEFMLNYKPDAREQGRSNSGFYQVDRYEVQILDSFGLEGENNECGAIYSKSKPKVNMCFPPLTWQTYDVEFTNALRDDDGKKTKNAVMTVKHNGVLVHDKVEVNGNTVGGEDKNEGTPGPLQLQHHGNRVQFRNVWVVEKK